MDFNLARVLVERNIIKSGTKILAKCPIIGMGGVPAEKELFLVIERIINENDNINCVSKHTNGRRFIVPVEKVSEIDGMEPSRLGLAFDIKLNNLKKVGKKRGRKPKINITEKIIV